VAALDDDEAGGLAATIIGIGETLGHLTIAEGVESAAQAARLQELGCRLAQGYHLGRPLDAAATESLLQAAGGSTEP
jgi:EAL domain-containing protein (putative c-di-GMP-specific phosphodiesterase class I)